MTDDDLVLAAARAVRGHLPELAPVECERITADLDRLLDRATSGGVPAGEVREVLDRQARVRGWVDAWLRDVRRESPAAALPVSPAEERRTYPSLPEDLLRSTGRPPAAPLYHCPLHPQVEPKPRHNLRVGPPRCDICNRPCERAT